MYQTEKQTIIDTAKLMDRYGLICLSGGNICVRVAENSFLITPSAIRYDDMVADDIVLINETGKYWKAIGALHQTCLHFFISLNKCLI